MGDWIQDHWFELGSLLAQMGILATLAWFGRKALAVLAGSPRTAEAERRRVGESAPTIEPEAEFHGGLRGLIPMEQEEGGAAPRGVVAVATAGADRSPKVLAHAILGHAIPGHAILAWLNTPWKGGIAWRRVSRQLS